MRSARRPLTADELRPSRRHLVAPFPPPPRRPPAPRLTSEELRPSRRAVRRGQGLPPAPAPRPAVGRARGATTAPRTAAPDRATVRRPAGPRRVSGSGVDAPRRPDAASRRRTAAARGAGSTHAATPRVDGSRRAATPGRAVTPGGVGSRRAATPGGVGSRRAAAPRRATLLASPQERRRRTAARAASIPDLDTSRTTPARLRLLLGLCVLVCLGIVGRLVELQVRQAPELAERARKQLVRSESLPAERGSIFDRAGRDLAISVQVPSIAADPRLVTDPRRQARLLSSLLNIDADLLEERLSRPGAKFTYVARTVDEDAARRVAERASELPGVFSLLEPKRFLPADDLALPLLGKVSAEGEGLSGLEYQYRDVLAGKPGKLVTERDQRGREIPGGRIEHDPSARGDDLVLTIDRSLQHETERRLADQIATTSAKGGIALVMDTASGDLLAVANLVAEPAAEAAATGQGRPAIMPAAKNEAVTNVYEPGSVAKLITVAGAIEDAKVRPDQTLSVANAIQVGDHRYTEHEPHPTKQWSVTDIVANSSNVGTIMIGQQLGKERFDAYLRAFGFGAETGLADPGESAGILADPADYTSTSMGSFPIGQGIAVTAAQMLAAYNAVANGGLYVAPRLVRATVGPDGTQRPQPGSPPRQVISRQTAAEMTKMLTEVVRVGTGTLGAVEGYTVAGKTGTARKPLVGKRGYETGAYVSSFAGFVPAEKPQLTAMVLLDQPTPIFGGLVAAPVFSDLARYALGELRIPPPVGGLSATVARSADAESARGVGDVGDATAPATLFGRATAAPRTPDGAAAAATSARTRSTTKAPAASSTSSTTAPGRAAAGAAPGTVASRPVTVVSRR